MENDFIYFNLNFFIFLFAFNIKYFQVKTQLSFDQCSTQMLVEIYNTLLRDVIYECPSALNSSYLLPLRILSEICKIWHLVFGINCLILQFLNVFFLIINC